ncbi:MAG: penicillin-binding protein activator [Gammaproteobacteria bacterium]|nr:penicillin-binding protein activator [Gammaproteobacteria bacterium]
MNTNDIVLKHKQHIYIIIIGLMIAILVTACGGTPPRPSPTPDIIKKTPFPSTVEPTDDVSGLPPALAPSDAEAKRKYEDPAQHLINFGRYLDAALLLSELAASVPAPQKQEYQLQITSLLLQGNYLPQAEQILNEINITDLPANFHIRKTLLAAQLELANQRPETAVTLLSSIANMVTNALPNLQREFYNKQIDAYYTQGNYAGSATARAALNLLITDQEEIEENQETILRDLQELSLSEIADLSDQPYNETMQGWVALAYIAKSSQDEQQVRQQIEQWLIQYPNHRVNQAILDTIIAHQPQALGRPEQIALILPFKGRFAKASKTIRDGFLASYYNQKDNAHRPRLRIYDEGDNPQQIRSIYDQAVMDGADFIVGPLNKDAVNILAQYNDLQIPLLSLNYSENPDSVDSNFFQMSLSPEQEAHQVAEHAWLDGHQTAAAIFPKTKWGDRVYSAFKARWEELGGKVVEHQTYDAKKSDYGLPIKKLLNIDESEARLRDIKKLAAIKIEYEPRRRKDVDMIFMAAFARQGRLLRPQLRFHRATNIPVYATSHVFTGSLKPNMDRDMNGVKFSDMPWTLTDKSSNKRLKAAIERIWPNESKRYMRLFALGIDAFNVLPELNRLRRNRFSSFQGETGLLYLDISNRLLRRLVWAQFVAGKPKILDKF